MSAKSLSTHFQLVKDAIRKAEGDTKRKRLVLSHLSDVGHRIPMDTLTQQIWYNRHMNRAYLIEKGKIKLVDRKLGRWAIATISAQLLTRFGRGALRQPALPKGDLGSKTLGLGMVLSGAC